jgi:hypothetical protein
MLNVQARLANDIQTPNSKRGVSAKFEIRGLPRMATPAGTPKNQMIFHGLGGGRINTTTAKYMAPTTMEPPKR